MKALASRNRSGPTSAWSFFCLRLLLCQAGDLVGHADKLPGQLDKTLVIGHQRFQLRGLLGGHALGKLLALNAALQNKVGALRVLGAGAGAALFEELAAQAAAAEAVNGLDLPEDLFASIFELRNIHGQIVSL